ncbi:hypothetical protein CDEST_05647 [Colletotrichum destructivum]|uniref:Uncharacterized protein n=1 Tax=Colletotrichum destructivum TaxID=34406 RepID=A0AAX4ICC0_9PEZI|nr:hypothetical protein CDEST_05647 [Colletotrichum destructivum]
MQIAFWTLLLKDPSPPSFWLLAYIVSLFNHREIRDYLKTTSAKFTECASFITTLRDRGPDLKASITEDSNNTFQK